MLQITGNEIYLTRGDSASITISLQDNLGNSYQPIASDKLYFRLKKNVFGDKLVLLREIDVNSLTLNLLPSETSRLEYMTYHYEIELVTASGYCYTVIEDSPFVVGPELEIRS